jgi:glycosyltransferase involved in cell wall biosynthesis
MNIAIDFSRRMSGGGYAHAIGILSQLKPEVLGIEKIYIFSSIHFLSILPENESFVKITHNWLNKSLPWQILWQVLKLKNEIKKYNCKSVLFPDAGTFVTTKKCVVMSRDMLSFEHSEIERYKKTSYMWFRLFLLRYIQLRSLNNATIPLFLTKYAAEKIREWGGPKEYVIIPHGINQKFKDFNGKCNTWQTNDKELIKCVYVSNIALYKHQWNVLEAISDLRKEGFNVIIDFIGGGRGEALKKFEKLSSRIDPEKKIHNLHPHIENNKLPEIISQYKIFLFASSCENMPNTLIEGMSLGMPIVSSNRGPMPEVLKDGGIYFDPENTISIFNAIKEIITNSVKRNEVQNRALDYSKEFSWEKTSYNTFKLLSDLAKS